MKTSGGNEEISNPPTVANYASCGRRVHWLVVLQPEAFKLVTWRVLGVIDDC